VKTSTDIWFSRSISTSRSTLPLADRRPAFGFTEISTWSASGHKMELAEVTSPPLIAVKVDHTEDLGERQVDISR
jgi:hypothetical protein